MKNYSYSTEYTDFKSHYEKNITREQKLIQEIRALIKSTVYLAAARTIEQNGREDIVQKLLKKNKEV